MLAFFKSRGPVFYLLVLLCLLLLVLIGLYTSGYFGTTVVYNNHYYTTPDDGKPLATLESAPVPLALGEGDELVGKAIKVDGKPATGGSTVLWRPLPFSNGTTKGEIVSLYASGFNKAQKYGRKVDSVAHDKIIGDPKLYNKEKKCFYIAQFEDRVIIPCPKIYARTLDPAVGTTTGWNYDTKELALASIQANDENMMVLESVVGPAKAKKVFHDLFFDFVFTTRVCLAFTGDLKHITMDEHGNFGTFTRGEFFDQQSEREDKAQIFQWDIRYGSAQHGYYKERTTQSIRAIGDGIVGIGNNFIPSLHDFVFFNTTGVTVSKAVIDAVKKNTPKKYKSFFEFFKDHSGPGQDGQDGPDYSKQKEVEKMVLGVYKDLPNVKSNKQAFIAIPDVKILELRRFLRKSFPLLVTVDDLLYKILTKVSQGECAVCAFSENTIARNISKYMASDLLVSLIALLSTILAIVRGVGLGPALQQLWMLWTVRLDAPVTEPTPTPVYPGPEPEPVEPDAKVRMLMKAYPKSLKALQTIQSYASRAHSQLYNI